ncbi:hypothetical protein ES703_09600 [subsurface metagenome]
MIPRKKMVIKNRTLADYGQIDFDYPIKLRVKEFTVRHKNGSIHKRGPCLSLQQFNPEGHFLSAVSIKLSELGRLRMSLAALGFAINYFDAGIKEHKDKKIGRGNLG